MRSCGPGVIGDPAMLLPEGLFKAFMIIAAAYLAFGYFGIFYAFGYFLLMWLMEYA
jgi:hypothetical protein